MSNLRQRTDMLETFRDTFQTVEDTSYSDLEGDINIAKVPSDDTYLPAKFQKHLPEKILVRLSDLSEFGISMNDLRAKGMVYNDEFQRWEEIEAPASTHVDMTGFATTNSGGSNASWDDEVEPLSQSVQPTSEKKNKTDIATIKPSPQLTIKTTGRTDDITDMSGFDSEEETGAPLLQLPSQDRHTEHTATDVAADAVSTPQHPARIDEEEDEDFDRDFAMDESLPVAAAPPLAPSTSQASVYLKKVFGSNKSSGPRLIRPDDYTLLMQQQASVPATPTTTELTPPPPEESWDDEFDFDEEGEAVTKLSLKMPTKDTKCGDDNAPMMVFDRAALRWTAVHGGKESAEFEIDPSPNAKSTHTNASTVHTSPAKMTPSTHTRRSTAEDFTIDTTKLRECHARHMTFVYQFLGEASYHKLLSHHCTPVASQRSIPRKGTPTASSPLLSRSFFQTKEHMHRSTSPQTRAMDIFAQYKANSAPSQEEMPNHISKRKLFVFDELTKEVLDLLFCFFV